MSVSKPDKATITALQDRRYMDLITPCKGESAVKKEARKSVIMVDHLNTAYNMQQKQLKKVTRTTRNN